MQSYTHFTLSEREILLEKLNEKKSLRKIAEEIGRNVSSISRELKRNKNHSPHNKRKYHPWQATILYIVRRKKCRRAYRIDNDAKLLEAIKEGLSQYWSPEIITARWKMNEGKLSHSTIYAALRRKAIIGFTRQTYLRRRGKKKNRNHCYTIHPEHIISDRPAIVESRERFGDWEGDTIYGGLGKGYLLTCVDRKSRILAAATAKDKYNTTINESFETAFKNIDLPIETMTLDNGSEFGGFKELEKLLKTTIYFAHPHSPWERGSNENINGLLRFFFPKGCDFRTVSDEYLGYVVTLINNRPRKCLGWLSPVEFINKKCCT